MNTLYWKVIQVFVRVIAKINPRLPNILEIEFANIQGRGSGGSSVGFEAKTAIDFLQSAGVVNPVVLDIGANIGEYTSEILHLRPNAQIFAFEPSSAAREKLLNRFSANAQVVVSSSAMGIASGNATLWSDSPGSGLASLTKRRLDHFGIEFESSEEIEVTTLDEWQRTSLAVPDLIKMDVEGHELDILCGGTETLKLAKVIQFEFGGCNIDTRTFFQDFWYLLTDAGFAIYRISSSGPIEIPEYSEADEHFRTTNYVGVRRA